MVKRVVPRGNKANTIDVVCDIVAKENVAAAGAQVDPEIRDVRNCVACHRAASGVVKYNSIGITLYRVANEAHIFATVNADAVAVVQRD